MPSWKYLHFATDGPTGDNPSLEILDTIAVETRDGEPTRITPYLKASRSAQSPLMESSADRSAKP